ncbi:MAG: two-component system NtrC family sensor kinase [bacterium]|jgi:two-component system NtrC family sensor kinase
MNSKSTQNQYPIFSGQLNKNISLSKKLIFSVVFISFLPSILGLLGFNFSSIKSVVIPQNLQLHIETSFTLLSGAFTHTILEWSAFVTAIFTALLTFISFKINKDVTAPIIGVSLFFAGIMDAFHVLASDHLIQVTAKNADFIPFTWTLCRVFNPLILIVGLSLILTRQPKSRLKHNFQFVLIISFIFGFFAYGVIHISAISSILPHIIFPNAIITRSYDLMTFFLYFYLSLLVFFLFCFIKKVQIFFYLL